MNGIEVGSNTNIQDNVIIHVAKHSIDGKPMPTIIGSNVTIGALAMLGPMHGGLSLELHELLDDHAAFVLIMNMPCLHARRALRNCPCRDNW